MEVLNKKIHKNKWVYVLIILFLFAITFFINTYLAKAYSPSENKLYIPLAPIQANVDIIPASGVSTTNFSLYLNNMFKLGIAVAGALAVIQIIIGGMKYVTSATMGQKGDGKAKIEAAIMGLVVVLGAYALLNTIDSRLLRTDVLNKYNPAATVPLSVASPCPTVPVGLGGGNMAGLGAVVAGLEYQLEPCPVAIPKSEQNTTTDTSNFKYASGPGKNVIGTGEASVDLDGSPGVYKVEKNPSGSFVIKGERYKSVGFENLANAGGPGNWYGVKTDNNKVSGNPIINPDMTLNGTLSYAPMINKGEIIPFSVLTNQQLSFVKTIRPGFKLGDKILVTANGKTVETVYADNGGNRGMNHTEIGPATARALGVKYGKNYANGTLTFSLPD